MENNKNLWVLPTDKPSRLYQLKNNIPSSEFEHEDKCPSCGSPCNIHTDLDDNDKCNECRDQIDGLEMGQIVPKQFSKILTAEEFLDLQHQTVPSIKFDIRQVMIEFAKMHVQVALKSILENVTLSDDKWDSILNAYPLTNIK